MGYDGNPYKRLKFKNIILFFILVIVKHLPLEI